MKKLYAVLVFLTIGAAAHAQCTPNPSLFGAANNTNYSIIPDTATNLPIAYVGVGYNTDLQFHIKPDTVTSLGTYNINNVHIDSVIGLPANFAYLPNPSNGTFSTPNDTPPGTGYGCVAVTGNAVSGQEIGGPNSDGIYPITVYYTATVNVFNTPTPAPGTVTGYRVHIVDPNAVPAIEITKFSVAQNSPNPANAQTEFRIGSPVSGVVNVTLYDLLGSAIRDDQVSAVKGNNKYVLETSSLADGIYLCSFTQGGTVITRRITVSH